MKDSSPVARKKQRVRFSTIAVAMIFVRMLAAAGLAASQKVNLPGWSMLGRDCAHTGRSDYKAIANAGAVKWRFQSQSNGYRLSIPAIGTNGIIYIDDQQYDENARTLSSHLIAIGPGGTQLWALRTDGILITENEASPAVGNDGTIYVTGVENIKYGLPKKVYLYAVSSKGILLWQSEIEGKGISSPTLGNNGLIYVGTADTYGNGHLYAIEPNGDVRWKVETGDIAMSSPAIDDDGTIYAGSYGHIGFPRGTSPSAETLNRSFREGWKIECDLYAIDKNGETKWKFKTDGPVASSPTIAPDGTIYVVDTESTLHAGDFHRANLYAIHPNGELKWKLTKVLGLLAPSIGSDGTIYLGARDDSLTAYLYALTPDRKIEWKFSDEKSGKVSWRPAIGADGTVFLSGDGLWAIDRKGTLKWKYDHRTGSPVIGSNGTIYATCGPKVELCAFGKASD